jgi:hypothetical protein
MVVEVEEVAPSLSVTVKVTWYSPFSLKVNSVVVPVEVEVPICHSNFVISLLLFIITIPLFHKSGILEFFVLIFPDFINS